MSHTWPTIFLVYSEPNHLEPPNSQANHHHRQQQVPPSSPTISTQHMHTHTHTHIHTHTHARTRMILLLLPKYIPALAYTYARAYIYILSSHPPPLPPLTHICQTHNSGALRWEQSPCEYIESKMCLKFLQNMHTF